MSFSRLCGSSRLAAGLWRDSVNITRNFSGHKTSPDCTDSLKSVGALMDSAKNQEFSEKVKFLRSMTFYVAFPAILISGYIAYRKHHEEHSKPRPEYIPYHYLNIRKRPFPWGDGNHTLFHNPKRQYVPGVGFEEDDDHH